MSSESGRMLLDLPENHPGVADREYRRRRAEIAETGAAYRPGDPIPDVEYTDAEHEVWRTVSRELAEQHAAHAVPEYLDGARRLDLPHDRVPQLRELDCRTRELTGFGFRPVPGLVPPRVFYGALAERTFLSTQYLRHHSVPFYTPEPDLIHEIIGHGAMLASPVFADLYEAAGRASLRTSTDAALEYFSRVFWFTLEFGVAWERGDLRAYGAGLLSSYGEIQVFGDAEIRPWDLQAMATLGYDISVYQTVLFAASSFDAMASELTRFFETTDFDKVSAPA
jgi:phenylalanine-4-hydroxylase